MAAFASSADNCNNQTRTTTRTRRTHQKVRLGCITCKTRRKKCDETKPCCLRCTNTGRKCDGYASEAPNSTVLARSSGHYRTVSQEQQAAIKCWSSGLSTGRSSAIHPVQARQIIWRAPSSALFASETEVFCFDYFRHMTGPQLGRYHSSSLYRTFVIRAALSHPVMMKAAAAVGAAHRRYDLGISKEAFTYCEISDRLFAEARAALADFERENKNQSYANDVIFVAALLHGVFEVFQSNHDKATEHFARGVSVMWNRPTTILSSDSQWRQAKVQPNLFHCLYRQLSACTQSIIGRQPRILTDFRKEPMPAIPPIFRSPGDGVDLIFTEAFYILQTPASIWTDTTARRKLQTLHVARLLQWSATYADSIDTATTQDPQHQQALALQRRFRSVTYLLLYLVCFAMNDPGHKGGRKVGSESEPLIINGNVLPTPSDARFTSEQHVDMVMKSSHRDASPSVTTNDLLTCGKKDPRHETLKSLLAIDSPELWDFINQNPDILGNICCVTMQVESLLSEGPNTNQDPYDLSLNFDTGFGPPRSNVPSPDGSSKTRHLVRTLLDPESRADVFLQSQSRYEHQATVEGGGGKSLIKSSPSLSEFQLDKGQNNDDDSSSNNNHKMSQAYKRSTNEVTRAYGIAEQLCSIEEHAVLAAAKITLMVPRGLKPQWLDISYYLEERRVRVRYCSEDDGSRGVIGAPGGLVWTQEWITF